MGSSVLAGKFGIPGKTAIVCPAVVGRPVPTAEIDLNAPLPVVQYTCPLKILTTLMFVTEVLNCVEVVEPFVVYRTPAVPLLPVPASQISIPFVLAALLKLLPLNASVRAVVASILPSAPITPTTRFTLADVLDVIELLAGSGMVSYPVTIKNFLSSDLDIIPSVDEVPELMIRLLAPDTVTGIG